MKSDPLRWDIFCRVVDNYGDIGVCWRLARQLVAEHHFAVRLWVDDLASFQRIQADIDPAVEDQSCAGVQVCLWGEDFAGVTPGDVVIEAFACDLPADYIAAMKAQPAGRAWLNLEYLSAEDWVISCHGLPSPAHGLPKFFFFPGFVDGTGGVLGELAQRAARAAWQPADAAAYLAQWLPPVAGALKISVFAYENAGLAQLLDCWQNSSRPVQLFIPEGLIVPQAEAWLGERLQAGMPLQRGALTLCLLPMQSQPDYDRLLWSCDLNFVRGEDSFVRAQWAGLPLIWHIYPQDEDAHLVKLDAFLAVYLAACPGEDAQALNQFWQAWNRGQALKAVWDKLLPALPALNAHAAAWQRQLAQRGDLATNLVRFINSKVKWRVKF
ncbi:MAG: elongation factor P maturation arginine rhamnosyltransferase EarP [Iodobacter sp.]